jgi:hypothetical protein
MFDLLLVELQDQVDGSDLQQVLQTCYQQYYLCVQRQIMQEALVEEDVVYLVYLEQIHVVLVQSHVQSQ